MNFSKLHKTFLLGLLLLTVTSCTLPPFVNTINHIKTGVDGLLMLSGEKTTNDRVLSDVTEMDCRMDRLLMSKEICLTKSNIYYISKVVTIPLQPGSSRAWSNFVSDVVKASSRRR